MTEEEIKALQDELEASKNANKALENNKSRIIDESNDFKSRAQAAEDKLAEDAKLKLESEGKLEERLALEKADKIKIEQELTQMKSSTIKATIKAEVAKHAKDAHNVDMLLKLTKHKESLKVNEDLTVSGVEDFVAKARESDPYLFSTKKMPVTEDGKPVVKEPIDNKTTEEAYRAALKACNNRKELDAIKVKYGKNY